VRITGDWDTFVERYTHATRENVIEFLTFDRAYPNSILSCLERARESARGQRQIISSEMWEHVNRTYLMVRSATREQVQQFPHDFYNSVKNASHAFVGITTATMSHGEAWQFSQLGRMIERADKTSRILDVKYFILLPQVQDVGTPFDHVQWSALLRSVSAFEMYLKRYGRVAPPDVAQFLILDRDFPRAIHFCVIEAEESMRRVTGSPEGTFANPAERRLGQLRAQLAYSHIEDIIGDGLHEFLDHVQRHLNSLDIAIYETFFALQPPEQAGSSASTRPRQYCGSPASPIICASGPDPSSTSRRASPSPSSWTPVSSPSRWSTRSASCLACCPAGVVCTPMQRSGATPPRPRLPLAARCCPFSPSWPGACFGTSTRRFERRETPCPRLRRWPGAPLPAVTWPNYSSTPAARRDWRHASSVGIVSRRLPTTNATCTPGPKSICRGAAGAVSTRVWASLSATATSPSPMDPHTPRRVRTRAPSAARGSPPLCRRGST
jgi:uncharacterized alpha-E superfamily protein